MKLKSFTKVFKWLLIYMLCLVASVFIAEYSRLKLAQKDIYNFMRIANNYALTATQDASALYDDKKGEFNNVFSDIAPYSHYSINGMYQYEEYKNFIEALEKAAIENEGADSTGFLGMTSKILRTDFERAVRKMEAEGNSPRASSTMDAYLTYTPLSFNIPYISYKVYVANYTLSLGKMLEGYNVFGKPAIWIGNEGSPGLQTTNGVYSPCRLICDSGSYSYSDAEGHTLTFSITPLNEANAMMIYGNNTYDEFLNKIKEVMNKSGGKYEDARIFSEGTSHVLYMPYYDVTVDTEWYYVSFSSSLRARAESTTNPFLSLALPTDFFDGRNGVSTMGSVRNGDVMKHTTGNEMYNQRQIMWYVRKHNYADTLPGGGFQVFKRYIFLA